VQTNIVRSEGAANKARTAERTVGRWVTTSRKERLMLKKMFVRGFVVVAVLATGGVAIGAVQPLDTRTSVTPAAAAVMPKATVDVSEASVRTAVVSACGGRPLVTTLSAAQTESADRIINERALHAASLAANPLDSGSGFQAGVDDALHVQMLDRQLADVLCPTP